MLKLGNKNIYVIFFIMQPRGNQKAKSVWYACGRQLMITQLTSMVSHQLSTILVPNTFSRLLMTASILFFIFISNSWLR